MEIFKSDEVSNPSMHKVEILYFVGCPNFRKACDIVCKVFEQENKEFELSIRPVSSETLQKNPQFYGSPTVLIDGKEIETCYSKNLLLDLDIEDLSCRIYDCSESKACPSEDMVLCALNE